jgi:chemotaxis response regulator CheB
MNQPVSLTAQFAFRSDQPIGAVAIIASAGGIQALITLLRHLPATFALPIFVAQHLPPRASNLDAVLSWHSSLNVRWALEGDEPHGGCVYLVPPGMCLGVMASGFQLAPLGVRSSSWLASGDHLINSMVAIYGARSIGIVLSGMLPAGVNGMRTIKAFGGFTLAQDRLSSSNFDMPAAAIDFGKAEIVTSPKSMAVALSVIADSWRGDMAA